MSAADDDVLDGFELTWTDGGPPADDARWIPAVVPGGVHESLVAAGVIGHPYAGRNEETVGWVEDATWWYRTTFAGVDGEQRVLHLEGLDTLAEVWLDGRHLGTARNQHRPHTYDVTLGATNELVLRFPPPLDAVAHGEAAERERDAVRARQATVRPDDPPLPERELTLLAGRPQVRKATFSWGWDFAARVPSRGVAAPVTLRAAGPALLDDVRVRSLDVDVEARTCRLQISAVTGQPCVVDVEVLDPSGAVVGRVRSEGPGVDVEVPLTDVRLWWTHDLGEPALYTVSVTAVAGGTTASRVLRHGVRTFEIDRSPDSVEGGRAFRFVLNGRPTFARGACWVPPSLLVGSVDDATTRELVVLARDGGMTMIRVWGGGVYGTDAFYDACDELGVMVWQDFMFACYDYPDPTGALAEETALEAAHQVRRLRHHASLALWCGENEVQAIHELVHGVHLPRERGAHLFLDVLPSVVAEHDADRPYWPGSPWGEAEGELLNGTSDGDRHAWEVWHGNDVGAGGPTEFASPGERVHWSRFDHDRGRFVSEFGIHAAPELATLRRWAGPDADLTIGSPDLEHRIKDTPKDKGFALIEHETGLPDRAAGAQAYVDVSMACQAEGLKHGVEHYRRRQPHCSGTLVWQLNDAWPGLSWSVIDHDLVPKAGYYFLQRAFQPLLASFAVEGDGLILWVTNSGRTAVELDLTVALGPLEAQATVADRVAFVAPPYSSEPVWSRSGAAVPGHGAWVTDAHDRLPANRRFFGRLRDLPVRDGDVRADVLEHDAATGRAVVRLTAGSSYAYFAHLRADRPGPRFSTNYVDLCPGASCDVEVRHLDPVTRLTAGTFCGAPVDVVLGSPVV